LWIFLTDRLVYWFVSDPLQALFISTYKGWFFVLASTALIYFSLAREMGRRKVAETELQLSRAHERMLADVIEKSFQPFAVGYDDGRMGVFNAAFCDLVGYRPEELQVMNWAIELTPAEWKTPEMEYLTRLQQSGKPVRYEKEYIRKDGSRVPVELFVHQKVDEAGQFLYFYAFITDLTERKQAEKLRKESDERYRSLFENMLNGYAYCQMIFDQENRPADFTYLDVNDKFEILTGLKDVVGKNVSEVIPGIRHTDSGLLEIYGRVSLTGIPERFELHLNALDMWLEISVYGGPERGTFIAVFDVITERKRADEALRQKTQELESFFQVNLDLLCIADTHGYFRKLNPQWESTLGYLLSELEDHSFLDLVHPDDLDATKAAISQLTTQQNVTDFINRYRCKDGSYRWIEWRSVPQGELIFAAARDVTEHRKAEQTIRESEYWLKESQRIAGIGSYMLDILAGQWISSPELDIIFGIAPDFDRSIAGWATIIHPDHREMMVTYFTNLLTLHQNFDKEYRIVRINDGQERWVYGLGNFDYDEKGKPLRMYGTIQDITDRKRSELALQELNTALEERVRQRTAQLEISNKELEAFSYSVSHDLRAPLRHLNGYSQMLVETYGEQFDPQAHSYLERIQDATSHMGKLIDGLLNLSRLARNELVYRQVNLSALARAVFRELRQNDPQRVVEFSVRDGLFALADETLMRVVFENLLGNAWKFTSKCEQANIDFGCEDNVLTLAGRSFDRPQAVFFIRDNGTGFDMAYVSKLFGPFQRLHHADEFPGTGIGLTTVQRIIHRHGGQVWADGKPDHGATFYFTLPIEVQR
jgi:PAS domain S-box-containing protein